MSATYIAETHPDWMKNMTLLIAACVIGVLLIMMVPLPTIILDILLTLNITLSIIVLLMCMYVMKPLDFSVFPSVLLILTLLRLSLNVASTRLVLLHGSEGTGAAGQVIKAFGTFVVGGNYVVGMIVFMVLVLINFVVITKGATRIAEVAARFTLDGLPGKQMSIDAEYNSGSITEEESIRRKAEVQREVDIPDNTIFDNHGFADIAIPAFDLSIGTIVDGKNVIPAVCVIIFNETIAHFKNNIHKRHVGAVKECFEFDGIFIPAQQHAFIFIDHFTSRILFLYFDPRDCFACFHARHSTLTRTSICSPTFGASCKYT